KVAKILGAMIAVGFAVACSTDRLLDVNAPNAVPVTIFDSPTAATLMAQSAIGDFECAFGSAVTVEGIISDELADSQLGAAGWPYDRRDANTQTNGIYGINPCNSNQNPGIYTPLSTARFDADNALTKLGGWTDAQVPNRPTLIAEMNLYAGFSYAMLGVSMCGAAFDLGPTVDQKGMFALAEKRFTDAISTGTTAGLPNVVNAAYVGRARVRLYQGNPAGAIADAQLVPKGFVYNASTDASDGGGRRANRVYAATQQFGDYTVEQVALNLQTENGEADPRAAVQVTATRPADSKTVVYVPKKYSSGAATNNTVGDAIPLPMARYEEAQLILAEAQGGAQAVTIINALRSAVPLKPYVGATDATSIKNLVIDERRRVLFVEGLRNYDIQRFNLPLVPATGTPYPRVGGTYGTTTCLPLPDIERFNNPNAK
ncbi:MAG TPA: RagB/SusD family nutrient uptake outer membrane protein, partial [Gemmatimonadaceae bacterium]